MKSITVRSFRDALARLPAPIQRQADAAYRRFVAEPHTQGLQFKRVSKKPPIYSARVNDDYRAFCSIEDDVATWFWIGKHEVYEK